MSDIQLVTVGSIGIDTIETPTEKRERILGGSASYACAASSFFARTGMVGVVGTDFPSDYVELYKKFGICLEGLQTEEGKTFSWSGVYHENMDDRTTLETHLNVFEHFAPKLPAAYADVPYLFLGNIHPLLQLDVLNQVNNPKFTLVDTMDLWINISRDELDAVVAKVDMLTLNESEARLYTDKHHLLDAAPALLEKGPQYVLIKKGAHGSVLFSKSGDVFIIPAFPVRNVNDPTGAGDSYAGGLMGYLAQQDDISDTALRNAMMYGGITASFGVEKFSLERLEEISMTDVEGRADIFRKMVDIPQ
ncbi:MAG: sugar/nucleoside kinase (ribokinase family) [Kiritimatiellia bacterium]|jgi:cytidine kinase